MNKQVNLLLILLISVFSYSQDTSKYTDLFRDEEPLKIKLKYSNKELNKNTNDSTFIETQMSYEQEGVWKEIDVRLRARGNFRRNTCYWPPVKMKIKKAVSKGTLFEGNKSLKLVLPCMIEPDKNDNIMKEYMAYKLYEQISPYHFNARRVEIEFTEIKRKKEKLHQLKGFLIEDDDIVADRFEGQVVDRFIHPLAMDAETSVQNAFFNFLIGNTDISVAYQHNAKLLYIGKRLIPLSYDFDMTGFTNPSYATVNETLGIKSVRDRKYRGFKRDGKIIQTVRELYISKKDNLISIVESHETQFDNKREYKETIDFLKSFYEIIEDDKQFKAQVLDAARTK
ncbi:MAG: hypothetical protein CMC79_05355 [Flavobacteriaceae bacterium]|nr:hypothetical protein [Flavobacteriaceae bacterium]|tara:strand:- start:10062 stop:11081 length:1020 start_codon:yes stop_codon:yes gene_type:complete